MIGIIISGHGNFASGLKSAIDLIVGKQENLCAVDFIESYSTDMLLNKIKDSMNAMDADGYIFFTDIPGGSPFKKCVEIALENENCEVVAGSNLPMIIEILFDRYDISAKELRDRTMDIGKSQIVTFEIKKEAKKIVPADGI